MLIPILLYTRQNCPLCAEAEAKLTDFAGRFPLSIESRDVDSAHEWRQTYGMEVPVVFLGDKKLFRYRIDDAAFEEALLQYMHEAEDSDDHT